ncbi:hypothetical protein BJ973_003166 [Actinoplanes tereljensis]|uniref:Xylan 1,4-beta-xylosidase n=1 Tax=Paractinoplanes tereljensis TaxID=571912 RepID=A0A919TY77_9ACTN|nr:hypothetical protein [Actinoplanes tereljensis]GIF25894.1 hypothetical protein Ate02nite_86240 [Actinoplanes tereljensis]
MWRSHDRSRRALLAALSLIAVGAVPSSARPQFRRPVLGVTHTQYTADGDTAAAARARDYLAATPLAGNQQIMGWGALNPQPAPGVFDWHTLDERVALLRRTTAEPVLTLCGAPDWMKGGQAGHTDWAELETAPREEHFDDFAALAAAVARRYPDVRDFLVWNELKGFYDPARNDWNIEAYTRLYNKVYAALKAANPETRVGGPYVVFDIWPDVDSPLTGRWGTVDPRAVAAIDYWMANKAGADFVAVDASSRTKDGHFPAGDVAATEMFADATRWLRERTGLPVWWAEFYPDVDPALPASSPRRAAVALLTLARTVAAGAAKILLWQPQEEDDLHSAALWADGGDLYPLAGAFAWLAEAAEAGRPITADWTNDVVRVSDGKTGIALDATTGRVTHRDRPW